MCIGLSWLCLPSRMLSEDQVVRGLIKNCYVPRRALFCLGVPISTHPSRDDCNEKTRGFRARRLARGEKGHRVFMAWLAR